MLLSKRKLAYGTQCSESMLGLRCGVLLLELNNRCIQLGPPQAKARQEWAHI